MATIIENKKGFRVIKTSNTECIEWGGAAVCDHCNAAASFGYLVSVLNHWICPECFDEWYKGAKRYEEDMPYEQRRMNEYKSALKPNDEEAYPE